MSDNDLRSQLDDADRQWGPPVTRTQIKDAIACAVSHWSDVPPPTDDDAPPELQSLPTKARRVSDNSDTPKGVSEMSESAREEPSAFRQSRQDASDSVVGSVGNDHADVGRYLVDVRTLAPNPPSPADYVFGTFIMRGAVTVIVGLPGVGKSTLSYAIATALAAQGEYLDRGPGRPVRVAYVDAESPAWLIRQKVSSAGDLPPNGFLVWEPGLLGALQLDALQAAIQSAGAELVVIDTLSRAFPVPDENDNAIAESRIAALAHIARTTGAALVLIGHTKKGAINDHGVYAMRGASATVGAADIVVNLKPNGQDATLIEFECVKNRLAEAETIVLRKAGAGVFELLTPGDLPARTDAERAKRLIENEAHRADRVGISTEDAVRHCERIPVNRRGAERALKHLHDNGVLLRIAHGRYVHAKASDGLPPHMDTDATDDGSAEV